VDQDSPLIAYREIKQLFVCRICASVIIYSFVSPSRLAKFCGVPLHLFFQLRFLVGNRSVAGAGWGGVSGAAVPGSKGQQNNYFKLKKKLFSALNKF
jgi:hypothetical protein